MIKKLLLLGLSLCLCACTQIGLYKEEKRQTGINDQTLSFDVNNDDLKQIAPSSNTTRASADVIYTEEYGPFHVGCDDIDATFYYQLNSISSQTIVERMRLFNQNNSVVHSDTKSSFYYTKGDSRDVTFTLPLHYYLTHYGLTLKIEFLNYYSRTILKEYSVTFFPPSNDYLSGMGLKEEIYVSRSLGFYGDGSGLKEVIETYDFRPLGDYLNVDYYYRLDLSQNYFLFHNTHHSLSIENMFLMFDDSNFLFPYFSHDSGGYIRLPLTFTKKGDAITLKHKNKYYINRKTLQISDTYRTDFVLTNDFYLPINGKNKFNDKQLYLELSNVGYDGISTSFSIKYDVGQSLIGVCTDGEYCVTGGMRK